MTVRKRGVSDDAAEGAVAPVSEANPALGAQAGESGGGCGGGAADGHEDASGFPKQERQSLSYWLQQVRSDPLLDHRSTAELPAEADTVVIGSGITGTLVAKTHLETWPEKSVVVLEAREFCSGATGRNAGHCKPDQWRGFAAYEDKFGTEQALKILQNEQATWEALVGYVREHNVDCDLWVGDTLDVPMTPEAAAAARSSFERYRAAGGHVDHITVTSDRAEAEAISRLRGALACYAWPASTLQPWKLTAHVMRSTLARFGDRINLQTNTPVTRVSSAPSASSSSSAHRWLVHTGRGTIACKQVVHATNAYSAMLAPLLRGLVRPTPHMCNKVVPPSSFAGSRALRHSYGVLLEAGGDGALFSVNPRSGADGVILFGGSHPGQRVLDRWLAAHPEMWTNDGIGTGAGYRAAEAVTGAVREFAERNMVGWKAGADIAGPGTLYDYQWSGIIGRSADGVPFVGALPGLPGQWVCAGHCGHGMARTFTAAPALVRLMAGAEWAETGLPEVYQITDGRVARLRAALELDKQKGEGRTQK